MSTNVRKLFANLYAHMAQKQHTIIVGARQTGKSTLMQQLANQLIEENKPVYSITFEDPVVLNAINEHPENIFNFIPRPGNERLFLFIDEVQYAADPSNFLKLLYDKYADQLKIVATGSSAFYIDRKFKDSLAGRKQLFELYPLDFEEFIDFRTNDRSLLGEYHMIRTNADYISLKRKVIENLFDEYLVFGGYPAVVLASDETVKINMLKELVNTYIKRDIHESNISDELKFYHLLTILASQTGSLLNTNELANTLKLSVTAIDNYLYVMRKTFQIATLPPFYGNVRKELTKMPKVYFNDTGLRNILLNHLEPMTTRLDKGTLTENAVYIRLRQLYGTDNLRYWRTADGNEVDFVVTTRYNEGLAIEAKYNADEFKPSKYRKFETHYPGYPLTCKAYATEGNDASLMAM